MSTDGLDYKICAMAIPEGERGDSVSVEALMDSISTEKPSTVSRTCGVMAKLAQFWENGMTIKYAFIGGTPKQQSKVKAVAEEWTLFANIGFESVPKDADVRISFDPQGGSWSYVGTAARLVPKDKPTMNLGWINDTEDVSPDEHGIILHEWGHTLGLMHEHQSPGRNKKLTLDEKKVYGYYNRTQGWNEATVKAQILDVYNESDVSNYGDVDMKSVMVYFMPAELNLEHTNIDINNQLSDLDKAYMVINYPRTTPHAKASEWTLDHALQVAQVTAETVADIKDAMSGKEIVLPRVRTDFIDYLAVKRGQRHDFAAFRANWCKSDDIAQGPSDVQHGFVLLRDRLWTPNTTINYGFIEGKTPETAATMYRQRRVRNALLFYESYTSLTFELVDISKLNLEDQMDRNKCPVRISFGPAVKGDDSTVYGWSFVGTDCFTSAYDPATSKFSGGQKWATIFLGAQPSHDMDDVNFDMADCTLYHELGHMLGLSHEHDSPNSLAGDTTPPASYFVATLFDKDSVMLYEDLPYNADPDQLTSLNAKPSSTDKALLSLLYPDSDSSRGKFANALFAFQFEDVRKYLDRAKVALAPGRTEALKNLRLSLAADLNMKPRLASDPGQRAMLGLNPAADVGGGGGGGGGGAMSTQMPGFVTELVDALKQFFNPGGNQRFTLQFPGRFLQQSEYAWDTTGAGIYGQFVKPVTVNEAEFRLTDQLYDLTDHVAGPNGTNLSIVYEQLLNNLLPKFVNNGLAKQQAQIRQWLLKEVPMTKWVEDIMARQQNREKDLANTFDKSMGITTGSDGTGTTISGGSSGDGPLFALEPRQSFAPESGGSADKSAVLNRLELSEVLTSEYLYAKQEWELERDALITQANQPATGTPESQKALDELTRKLVHITATRQAQLASKYADAVVLGHSHDVREYMGYLDISSPAEALQSAKDSLRESAMSSLNGAMKVYPVQLVPIDWFEGLSTSFKPEDLTSDPEIIRVAINAKSSQLDTLNAQLVALEMGARGDATKLQKDVDDAQTTLDLAQSTLAQTYSSNVINMAETCLDKSGKVDVDAVSSKVGIAKDILSKLPDQMEAVRGAQDRLNAASRALSQLMAAHSLAVATDTQQQQKQLRLQIQSMTKDLNDLQLRWQILTRATGGVTPPPKSDVISENVPTGPVQLPEDVSTGGSRWQTIMMTSTSTTRGQKTDKDSKASSEQWSLNLWLASGSGSSSSASASSNVSSSASDDTIDLAFRATLVTVDRGGWFQPQFFKESQAFYKVNKEVSWADDKASGAGGLMPGFPVGFLIAKDIVIRVTHQQESTDDTKKFDQESSSSSGGVLCFSYSRSDSASSENTSSNFQAYSNGFVVKIPGPQILGYIIQETGEDRSTFMPDQLPEGFFIPDESYDLQAPGKASGVNPQLPTEKPAEHTVSEDKLREVLSKVVNEQLDNIFAKAGTA